RRDADGVRLRVADGPRGARARPRPRRRPPREFAPPRRHAAGRAGHRDARRDPRIVRACVGRAGTADTAARTARARGPRARLQLSAVRPHRLAARLGQRVGRLRDGRQPRRALPLPDVLRECARTGVPRSHLGVYHAPAGEPVDLAKGSGKVFPDYTFGAHAAEVEVDTETGVVRVLRYAAAHDVGRAINPQSVEGQIEGGAVQGLGYGLMEEVVLEDGI